MYVDQEWHVVNSAPGRITIRMEPWMRDQDSILTQAAFNGRTNTPFDHQLESQHHLCQNGLMSIAEWLESRECTQSRLPIMRGTTQGTQWDHFRCATIGPQGLTAPW